MHTLESPLLDPAVGYLIIFGIALLFALAGSHKLRNLALFTEVFAAYRVLPEALARRSAWIIPAVELSLALALPWHACRPWALPAAIGLMIAYASGIALNIARGRRELDCGCGASGNRRAIAPWMVWRNLTLALALGVAALPWISRPLSGLDMLTVVGGLTAAAMLYAAIDRMLGDVAPKTVALMGRPS
jgi:hypothetical protein